MSLEAIFTITAKTVGQNAVEKLGLLIKGVGDKAGAAKGPVGALGGSLRGLADVAAAAGLAVIGKSLLDAGVEAQQTRLRIKNLASGLGEVDGVMAIAAKAAKQFALGNTEAETAVADLYGRLRPMGIGLEDVEKVFFGVNKAARLMGLSGADTSGVMLQLSQALGSGKLQGDELRSIMEQLPAVGQAVANVMGVNVSELKALGAEGKITTAVMIEAAGALGQLSAPPPTALQQFDKAMKDLRTELGENLLPLLIPAVQALTSLTVAFGGLPEPLQTTILILGALAIAIGPLASLISGVGTAIYVLAAALAAAKIGVLIAGLQTAVIVAVPAIISALSGMLAWVGGVFVPGILALLGPVGWTVLAVAAVVAMAIAFRQPLMDFVAWLWNWGAPIRKFWIDLWYAMGAAVQLQIRGIQSAWGFLSSGIVTAAVKVRDFVVGIWTNLAAAVSSMWKGVINGIISGINAAIDRINQLVRGANRVPGVSIPELSRVPYLAEGGYITRPTLAMVGEGRDSEYVIPEGKMAAAAQRYMAGQRGTSVLQAGGIIRQSATGGAGAGSGGLVVNPGQASINITTGPVQQLPNGEKAITIADLEMVARQVANQIYAGLRTPAGRRAIGVR